MKIVHIKDKLAEIGISIDDIAMGDFDYIGEFTAKRVRDRGTPGYKKHGIFYRSNYERGILIYYLIRQFNIESFLEIGFGRGYSTFCAAKAFHDSGVNGNVYTVDPMIDEEFLNNLSSVLPHDLFKYVHFAKGLSTTEVPKIEGSFDLVYVDGDHSYAATKADWELVRNRFNKFVLFDDYLLPTHDENATLQSNKLIDEIDWQKENCNEPEWLRMDRRLFADDRNYTDEQVLTGQVLLTKKGTMRDGDW